MAKLFLIKTQIMMNGYIRPPINLNECMGCNISALVYEHLLENDFAVKE